MIDYIILSIAVFSISWASILVILSNAPGIICAFWRMIISSIITLIVIFIKKIPLKLNVQTIASGLSLAAHFSFWMESLYKIPVSLSTTIVNLHPIFSAMIGTLMGESMNKKRALGIIISLIGSTIMVGVSEISIEENHIGILYALIGAISMSLYLSINRLLRERMDVLNLTFQVYMVGGISILSYILINNIEVTSYPQITWIYITLIALIPMLMGHTLLNYLIKKLGLITVAVSTLGEPIGATILAYIILHQSVDVNKIIGMTMTLIGIFITIIGGMNKVNR